MNLQNNEIKDLVLQSISQDDFDKFIKEYFDKIEQDLLMEDDAMGGSDYFTGTGNTSDGVLDTNQFRSAYLPNWDVFDTNGHNYANIVGYTAIGHMSDSHLAKTGNVKLPVANPTEENGPASRVLHPSKGEAYAQQKIASWEMYPFNQRLANHFTEPDIIDTAGYNISNYVFESVDSNKEENEKILNHFTEYCIQQLKLKERPQIHFADDSFAEQKRALGAYDPESKTKIVRAHV